MKPFSLAWLAAVVVAAMVGLGGVTLGSQQSASGQRWLTAWSTSQHVLGARRFTNATVRLIARVGVPGDSVRLRLDNTLGTSPVTIGRASVGARMRGAVVMAGTIRPVLFGGAPTVTIPAGGSVESDPVALMVAARQDLAVSLHLPETDVRGSEHGMALTTSYASANNAGDLTSDESAAAFKETFTSMPFLKAIAVQTSSPGGVVVAFGDSITDGFCAPVDGRSAWPDWLATRLHLERGRDVAVLNEGINGNTLTSFAQNASPIGLERLDRDVLSHKGVTHVIHFLGSNDIRRTPPVSQVTGGIDDVIKRVKAKGIRVYGATVIPRHLSAPAPGNPGWTAENSRIRQEVNQYIRQKAGFDGVIDFERAVQEPSNADRIAPPFNCDDIHPSPLGYYEMARAVPLTLF